MALNKTEYRHGERYLQRLKRFIDVVYALLFYNMLLFLPAPEDMSWKDKPYGLLSLLIENAEDMLRILIGLALILIYWNQNIKLFNHLKATNTLHLVLSVVQLIFVVLFFYFAISDPALKGGPSSPALQSISLSIAGFIGIVGWKYAAKKQLVEEEMDQFDVRKIRRDNLIEPVTALLNTPVAWLGVEAWTLGWLIIPVLVTLFVKKINV